MQDDSWDKGRLAEWFRETPPFAALPPTAHEELLDVSIECEYRPGELILQQRSTQHAFLGGVLAGEVRLFDDVTHLLEVPCLPGSLFGAAGLLRGGPLPYHAIASLPSSCVRIPAFIVHQLCEEHPAFADHFAANVWDVPNLPAVGTWVGGSQGRPYNAIAAMEGPEGLGDVLAVGMGDVAISWLQEQPTSRWTLVSKTEKEVAKRRLVHGDAKREQDAFFQARWDDDSFLQEEQFAVVIADYRNGAIDVSVPRLQYQLLARLRKHTQRSLYLLGHEPIEEESESLGGQIIQEVMRLRDVCMTLAYRHPHLVLSAHEARHALEEAGFSIQGIAQFPRQFGIASIHAMLNESLLALPAIPDSQLALALASAIRNLRERALAVEDFHWGIKHSHDYVIAVTPV